MKKAAVAIAFLGLSAFGAEWTGYISDAKCGKGHSDGSEKSVNCVKACIKGGQAAVFVAGDKVLKIANADKVPADLYGHQVVLNGELSGDTVTVATVKAAKH